MSTRTIAVCDKCGDQAEIKHGGPIDAYNYERELNFMGWWQTADGETDVCNRHPQAVWAER